MAEFLNKNIKHLRNIKGISQQDLADKVGIDRSTISRIENNEIETTIDNALKISDVLDVPIDDLLNKDLTNDANYSFDKFELLFNKHKDILTNEDKEYITFIIEKRRKEIDKQLDGE